MATTFQVHFFGMGIIEFTVAQFAKELDYLATFIFSLQKTEIQINNCSTWEHPPIFIEAKNIMGNLIFPVIPPLVFYNETKFRKIPWHLDQAHVSFILFLSTYLGSMQEFDNIGLKMSWIL